MRAKSGMTQVDSQKQLLLPRSCTPHTCGSRVCQKHRQHWQSTAVPAGVAQEGRMQWPQRAAWGVPTSMASLSADPPDSPALCPSQADFLGFRPESSGRAGHLPTSLHVGDKTRTRSCKSQTRRALWPFPSCLRAKTSIKNAFYCNYRMPG